MNAAADQRHVYLVHSCLQFILATGLAVASRRQGLARSTMIFAPSRMDANLFVRAQSIWKSSPFAALDVIAQRSAGRSNVKRGRRLVRSDILSIIDREAPTAGYVFNDRDDSGQAVLLALAKNFPQAQRYAVEDGSQAYTRYRYSPHSWYTKLRLRLLHGAGWTDVRVPGTHPYVQHFIATFPSLLRPELRGLCVREFPSAELESEPAQELGRALCRLSGFDVDQISQGSIILTASHSDYARRSPDYVKAMRDCVDALRAQGFAYVYKYHPGEQLTDYLGLAGEGLEVPRTLPAECLYLLARRRASAVIGGASTALLTAALLLHGVRVLTLRHASPVGDAWDDSLLQALGIDAIHDVEDMVSGLRSSENPA